MTENNKKGGQSSVGLRRFIAYVVLILVTFLCLVWFYVLFVNTTRSNNQLKTGFAAFPSVYLVKNMTNLLTAYAIHGYDFKGKKAIFTFILAIMMIPTQVTALGFIRLMTSMHLADSYVPLIVPKIAAPVTFFFMKQYMDSNLPGSLLEAARIDGAGEIRIFNTIVLPLMKPAIAVQAIFTFVESWNNYFTPNLIIRSKMKKTLPILLAELRNSDWKTFDMGQVYAMIAFAIFPVIIVYLLLSRYIVGGVTAGGVKE